MSGRRRRRAMVQFAIHPANGMLFAVDTDGFLWCATPEGIPGGGGMRDLAWRPLGGLPDPPQDEPGDDREAEYLPPRRTRD